jgi:hypothetical protein
MDTRSITVARALGLRHLVQAAWSRGSRSSQQVGAVIDLLHGASMLLLALCDAKRRRVALLDAGVACAFALGGRASRANDRVTLEADTDGIPPRHTC